MMYIGGKEYKFNIVGDSPFRPPNLYWFAFSALLIVVSVVALVTLGINWGIEFKGGYLLKARLGVKADVGEVRSLLAGYREADLEKSIIQTSEEGTVLSLRMPYIEDANRRKEIINDLKEELDGKYGLEEILQEEQVGSEWGVEVSRKAILALVVFLLVILVYITFRLEFKMAIAAILALIHDTLITVGIYSLSRRMVSPATVIAFLTILGYSLYDTIVVFDRVEENANLYAKSRMPFASIVNESVNQTLMRSIGTSVTTLLPIVTILGVLLGGYSSIFIASPMLAIWKEREPRYAAVREKVRQPAGAKEVILKLVSGKQVREEEDAKGPRERAGTASPGGEPSAGVAAVGAASKTTGKPRAKPQASKKKSTTKGPSGGKRKKKKKK
jgi:preprotein translocase SecF subunit